MTETLLTLSNLSHSFEGKRAIEDINFEIKRGEVVALLGANGAGKSTTLNIITGNLKADMGEVHICQHNIATHPKQAKANLGFLPDVPPLYPELTVYEYLSFAAKIHGVEKQNIAKKVSQSLELCGLETVKKKLIATLSQGFKQRVGIAQAITHDPALVILDEPTVGLDPVQMQDIRSLLHALADNHSVLLSTHLLAEAETSCNRVMIIDQGNLLLDQSIEDLQKTNRVKLRFNGKPSIDQLNAIPGCESVSCSQYGKYICRYSDANFLQHIQTQAIENDWQLYEISPVSGTLEQVFLDIVMRDSISPSAN